MSDRPTLWKWGHQPDCGHRGCSDALRDTVTSQGMVPATDGDLVAALGVEWWCDPYRRGEKPSPCVPHDRCAKPFWYCHWAVKEADDE